MRHEKKKTIIYPSSRRSQSRSVTHFPASHSWVPVIRFCQQGLIRMTSWQQSSILLKQHKRQKSGFFFFWYTFGGEIVIKRSRLNVEIKGWRVRLRGRQRKMEFDSLRLNAFSPKANKGSVAFDSFEPLWGFEDQQRRVNSVL